MSKYQVITNASFTIGLSAETGAQFVLFSGDAAKALAAMDEKTAASPAGLDILLRAMGKDAAAWLSAVGALQGVGGDLLAAYGMGGVDALADMLQDLAATRDAGFGAGPDVDRAPSLSGANDNFLPSDWDTMTGTDLAGVLGLMAAPEGKSDDPLRDALAGMQGQVSDGDDVANAILNGIAWGALGVAGGAVLGSAINLAKGPVPLPLAAAAGGVVGFVYGFKDAWEDTMDKEVVFGDDSTKTPVGPTDDSLPLTDAEFFEKFVASIGTTDGGTILPDMPADGYRPALVFEDMLIQQTQPIGPDDAWKATLTAGDVAGRLDPLINPGSLGADSFVFVDLGDGLF